ncbi:MAG: K(+)-transporting ATPase subunit F [Coriobacteriia bacterium]|nr:K(+)-transporting ATPase subunit F [Coriobacteriia bacterium]
MMSESGIIGAIAVALLAYLVWALVFPERL